MVSLLWIFSFFFDRSQLDYIISMYCDTNIQLDFELTIPVTTEYFIKRQTADKFAFLRRLGTLSISFSELEYR